MGVGDRGGVEDVMAGGAGEQQRGQRLVVRDLEAAVGDRGEQRRVRERAHVVVNVNPREVVPQRAVPPARPLEVDDHQGRSWTPTATASEAGTAAPFGSAVRVAVGIASSSGSGR